MTPEIWNTHKLQDITLKRFFVLYEINPETRIAEKVKEVEDRQEAYEWQKHQESFIKRRIVCEKIKD